MKKKLTKLQAFNVMSKLFKIYYKQTLSDDLGGILGGMSFVSDKRTADIAMLEIWTECLDKSFIAKRLRNYNHLTPLQAFLGMGEFVEEYFGIIDVEPIINFLEQNAKLAAEHKEIDKILWQNWLRCVDEVLSVKDSRMYLRLRKPN